MRRSVPGPKSPWTAALGEGRPIAELNMTPLIDVLLVLIVMFIMVIPAMTNEIPVTLDGVAVNEAALAARLRVVVRDEQATLVMETDPAARYERFVQVLAVVKRAGVERLGFEGLGVSNR